MSLPFDIAAIQRSSRLNHLLHRSFANADYEKCQYMINSCGLAKLTPTQTLYQAKVLKQQGKLVEAQQLLQQLIQIQSATAVNVAFYMKELVRVLILQGKYKVAYAILEEAEQKLLAMRTEDEIQNNPDIQDWTLLNLKAACVIRLGFGEESVAMLQKTLNVHRHVDSCKDMMKVCEQINRFDESVAAASDGLELAPTDVDFNIHLAKLALRFNNDPKALELYAKSLLRQQKNQHAILGLGNLLQRNLEYSASLVKYRVAYHAALESCELWNNMGMAFFGMDNLIAALTCLNRARQISPLNWAIAYNLALVHIASNNFAAALMHLTAANNIRSATVEKAETDETQASIDKWISQVTPCLAFNNI